MNGMKRVYFVRHGESGANATGKPGDPASPLTPKGERQSHFLAERFAHIPLDVIIASPYVRTRQTAEIFNRRLDKPVVYSELFTERRNPDAEIGLESGDPKRLDIHEKILEHFHVPGWRHSNEENFEDLHERGLQALAFLSERPETNVAVITHGGFLRMLVALMLQGPKLSSQEFMRIMMCLVTRNTGITLCEWRPDARYGPWKLITWNDHAHLGEIDTDTERAYYRT